MDPLPDFGLFELLAASGIAWLSRRIYIRNVLPFLILVASIIAPVVLIFIADTELVRWISAVCLATALINAGLIFPLLRSGKLARVLSEDMDAAQSTKSEEATMPVAGDR